MLTAEPATSSLENPAAIAVVERESMSLYERVRTLAVQDQETYDLSVELYKTALALEKEVHRVHDPVCTHWDKIHADACALRKKDLDKTIEAKKLAKHKGDTWSMEQERIRQENERRIQEEARKKAEEEARILREAQEAERRRLAKQEEEERIRLAAEAEDYGATHEQVTEILETPIARIEPVPYIAPAEIKHVAPPTFNKAPGFSARWAYSGKQVNFHTLVKAAAENPYFMQFLQPNESAINAQARSAKDLFQLPGYTLEKRRV